MLSKNEIKLITSLSHKKYRYKEGLFVAEGVKLVNELIESAKFEIYQIYATIQFDTPIDGNLLSTISEMELKRISQLVSPNEVLGVFKIPLAESISYKGFILALDGIQDPGNMGTIIRLCDWFGITKLVCSEDTVDCFNPKVVQATMGSLDRVDVLYTDLENYLTQASIPVFLTMLEGENIYNKKLPKEGILVMGNEGNGIRNTIVKSNFELLSIPRFGTNSKAESLNVATAAAVLLSEFRRNCN